MWGVRGYHTLAQPLWSRSRGVCVSGRHALYLDKALLLVVIWLFLMQQHSGKSLTDGVDSASVGEPEGTAVGGIDAAV